LALPEEKTVAETVICWYYALYINRTINREPVFHVRRKVRMVSFTDSAVKRFKDVVTKQGANGDGVRIFVVPGG